MKLEISAAKQFGPKEVAQVEEGAARGGQQKLPKAAIGPII
jgi:hypothetical protein